MNNRFIFSLIALVAVALSSLAPTPAFATADSLLKNTNGFFAKRASDGKYYPAILCFSTDGSQALIPCGKHSGGTGITPGRLATGTTNVTSSAYVDLVNSSSDAATWVNVYNGTSQEMVVAVGATSSEVDKFYVPATSFSGPVPLYLPSGSRISVKSKGSTASSGSITAALVQ
jgi:hypothetical protein